MTDPVAVVIPAFAAERDLAETLDSVLSQTHPAAEVCVTVDAASDDNTLAVARSYEPDVLVKPIEPTSSMRARQSAVEATAAPLVAPCDADDVWLPTKIERQVAALENSSAMHGVFCEVTEFTSGADGSPGAGIRQPHDRIDGRVASALMVRRETLDDLGGFAARDHLAQWIEWLSSAVISGARFGMVPEVLVRRRLRSDGYTSRHREQTPELLNTMRDHLRRSRDASSHDSLRSP